VPSELALGAAALTTQTTTPPARSLAIWRDRGLMARIAKYTTGSVVATISAEVTFLVVYGAGVRSTISTVAAFLAGAIPNYILNRRWAWQRTGRAHRREVARYIGVIGLSLLVTMAFTWVGARIANRMFETRGAETLFVGGVYLFASGVVFVMKFLLFNRFVFIDHDADDGVEVEIDVTDAATAPAPEAAT
jgi:putative flippase GtrA